MAVSGLVALGAFLVLRFLSPAVGDRPLAFLEMVLVLVPLAYAARTGGKAARIAAVAALFFAAVHLWTTRGQTLFFGMPRELYDTVMIERLSWTWGSVPWITLFYFAGIGACAAYLGLTLSRHRRVSIAIAVVVFVAGAVVVAGLATGTRLPPGSDDDSSKCGRGP
jgi:hypothetical protein